MDCCLPQHHGGKGVGEGGPCDICKVIPLLMDEIITETFEMEMDQSRASRVDMDDEKLMKSMYLNNLKMMKQRKQGAFNRQKLKNQSTLSATTTTTTITTTTAKADGTTSSSSMIMKHSSNKNRGKEKKKMPVDSTPDDLLQDDSNHWWSPLVLFEDDKKDINKDMIVVSDYMIILLSRQLTFNWKPAPGLRGENVGDLIELERLTNEIFRRFSISYLNARNAIIAWWKDVTMKDHEKDKYKLSKMQAACSEGGMVKLLIHQILWCQIILKKHKIVIPAMNELITPDKPCSSNADQNKKQNDSLVSNQQIFGKTIKMTVLWLFRCIHTLSMLDTPASKFMTKLVASKSTVGNWKILRLLRESKGNEFNIDLVEENVDQDEDDEDFGLNQVDPEANLSESVESSDVDVEELFFHPARTETIKEAKFNANVAANSANPTAKSAGPKRGNLGNIPYPIPEFETSIAMMYKNKEEGMRVLTATTEAVWNLYRAEQVAELAAKKAFVEKKKPQKKNAKKKNMDLVD